MTLRMNKTAIAVWAITTFACLVLSTATTRAANTEAQVLCQVASISCSHAKTVEGFKRGE